MARKISLLDPELGALTDDRLTRDVRVYQRAKGHRFSSDDVATAFVAFQSMPEARRVLDLGSGLGSVLLHLAWKLPLARLAGVEAQAPSFELLRRNLERSGFGARVRIHYGDLRERAVVAELGNDFDLVTGTPPYFPPEAALEAEDEQRAYARLEYRGGIEAYMATAAQLVAPSGRIVLCGDARAAERVSVAAAANAVQVRSRCDVVARAGRPPLFSVWSFARETGELASSSLVLRDVNGERTSDAELLRTFSGF